jgi:AraC-like DNA-binding protein
MDAKFEYLFYDTHPKTYYQRFDQHPCYELVYYLSGEGLSNIDGIDFAFEKNTFSLMPAASIHNRQYSKSTDFLAIGFLFNLPIEIKGGVYQDVDGKILAFLQEIKKEFLNKKPYFQLRLDMLIMEIVIQIDRSLNLTKNQNDSNVLIYIKKYIDLHYDEKINFRKLAELSFYSYDHFRFKFKEFTGYAPNHYLMIQRIENAKRKLVQTNINVVQIALECGFATSAQLCYLFKKYVSQTPLEFRKQYQQELLYLPSKKTT